MLKKALLSIIPLLALSFIACSTTTIQKDVKPNVSLENTYWKATVFYNKKVEVLNEEAHIKFRKDGSINGFLGCNSFFGSFEVKNGVISFEKVASTKMMCHDMQTEDSFAKVLQNTKNYNIKGETLYFYDKQKNKIATFKAVYF